jgi:Na+/melibiose symporter-like transporter
MASPTPAALAPRTLVSYALTELPLSMAATPIALFITPFYARDLGLSLAAIGTILMLARISDVITDPLVGQASDRTRTRFGRRKPWILLGAPLTMLSVWMLFVPSAPVGNAYFAFWLVALWLGWTFVAIPYYAFGAELSQDYHERTRIASVRTALGVTGTLTAICLPLVTEPWFGYGEPLGESLHLIATAALALFALAMLLLWRVPEGAPIESRRITLAEGFQVMARNGPFKRLMIGFTFAAAGPAIGGPLYVLYVVHVLEASVSSYVVLLAFYLSNLAGVVLWNAVARRVGKRNAWLMGMGVAIVAQPGYALLGPGDLYWMMAVFVVLGIGIGSFAALPAAMKADVVDLDRLRSGEDRTALFFSMWSLANKLVLAFSAGFALNVVAWFGFDAKGQNGPSQLLALKVVFIWLPVAFYLVALAVMWRYPITEERQRRLVGFLERRRARRERRRGGSPSLTPASP